MAEALEATCVSLDYIPIGFLRSFQKIKWFGDEPLLVLKIRILNGLMSKKFSVEFCTFSRTLTLNVSGYKTLQAIS